MNQPSIENDRPSVFIVGAGPTGLMMASQLARIQPGSERHIHVTLDRSLLSQDEYTLKLLRQGKLITETENR